MTICSDEGSTPSTSTSDCYPNTIEPVIRLYGGFGVFVFDFPIYTF